MDFTNHVVWITGASSGLGREMALEFARRGATVAVSARRMELLEALVTEIKAAGHKAQAFHCDVLDDASIAGCVKAVVETFGKLDVAVANAGFGVVGRIEELTTEDWSRQLGGNVIGLSLTCRHALPHLRKTKGRLALVGSVGAFLPGPGTGAYSASKAAVHSIGETLQVELAGSGVSCTMLHPGLIESNIARIDNAGNFHPDRKDPRPAKLMWPTDKAARSMVRAIANRKKVHVFTGHGKVLVFLGRIFPGLARKVVPPLPANKGR
jgi:NAD(P)-dependent dehydrogenase (short-subunit alcohol dehydrogenase family)